MKVNYQHMHVLPKCKKLQFQAVLNYLDTLPVGIPTAALRKVICPDFGLTEKQFYYILSKSRDQPLTITQLGAHL